MAYDEALASRIRTLIGPDPAVVERKMFGGLAFLVNGHMAVAASGQGGLLIHINAEDSDRVLADPKAEPMVMRGRPMRGWIRVRSQDLLSDQELRHWIELGTGYASSLPPK